MMGLQTLNKLIYEQFTLGLQCLQNGCLFFCIVINFYQKLLLSQGVYNRIYGFCIQRIQFLVSVKF